MHGIYEKCIIFRKKHMQAFRECKNAENRNNFAGKKSFIKLSVTCDCLNNISNWFFAIFNHDFKWRIADSALSCFSVYHKICKISKAKANQGKPSQVKPSQGKPSQVKTNQVEPSQAKRIELLIIFNRLLISFSIYKI